jgi:hypothetical protein
LYNEGEHHHDSVAIIEISENVSERISFVIELGPKPQDPTSFGVGLTYELYSAVVRLVLNPKLPSSVDEHFIAISLDAEPKIKVNKATAELEFYQTIHGRKEIIPLRETGGAYVILTMVPMAKPPKLTIEFNREDLSVDMIPFEFGTQPTHKVRFWICDKRGRNKTDDLRQYITFIAMNADPGM